MIWIFSTIDLVRRMLIAEKGACHWARTLFYGWPCGHSPFPQVFDRGNYACPKDGHYANAQRNSLDFPKLFRG